MAFSARRWPYFDGSVAAADWPRSPSFRSPPFVPQASLQGRAAASGDAETIVVVRGVALLGQRSDKAGHDQADADYAAGWVGGYQDAMNGLPCDNNETARLRYGRVVSMEPLHGSSNTTRAIRGRQTRTE